MALSLLSGILKRETKGEFMKTFIRTEYFESEDARDTEKEKLNRLGFYCLSAEPCGIEVYAIEEERQSLEERIYRALSII
jgi:hypothetical protein